MVEVASNYMFPKEKGPPPFENRPTKKTGSHLIRSIIRHFSLPRTTGFQELGTLCRPSDSYSSLDKYNLIV